jgi:hypothetical protein
VGRIKGWRRVEATVVAMLACGGCTSDAPRASDERGAGSSADSRARCEVATGQDVAQQGPISAGSFEEELLAGWRPSDGPYKVWVASDRASAPSSATVRLSSPGPDASVRTLRRTSPATPMVSDPPAVFFPGEVPVDETGQWRLEVCIGRDRACFLIDFGPSTPRDGEA